MFLGIQQSAPSQRQNISCLFHKLKWNCSVHKFSDLEIHMKYALRRCSIPCPTLLFSIYGWNPFISFPPFIDGDWIHPIFHASERVAAPHPLFLLCPLIAYRLLLPPSLPPWFSSTAILHTHQFAIVALPVLQLSEQRIPPSARHHSHCWCYTPMNIARNTVVLLLPLSPALLLCPHKHFIQPPIKQRWINLAFPPANGCFLNVSVPLFTR